MEYYSEHYHKNLLRILFKKNLWKSIPICFLISMAAVCEFNNPDMKSGRHKSLKNILGGIPHFGINQFLLSFAIASFSIILMYGCFYLYHKRKKMIVRLNIDEANNRISIYTKDWFNNIHQSAVPLDSLKIVKEEKQNDFFLNNSCDCYSFKSNKEIIGRYFINNFTWIDDKPILAVYSAIQKKRTKL